MAKNIEAIFLDTGNTMRLVEKDDVFQYQARMKLAELLGTQESPDSLCKTLGERYDGFKKHVKETLKQPSEEELWVRWMLPEYPVEKVTPIAKDLSRLWQDQSGRRVTRPDVKQTLVELTKRGYILGIIANTVSESKIYEWLEVEGLTQYFKAVVLSVTLGVRKPDPAIYLEAARLAGVEPAHCAYVGDNPTRDITGSREAGFGMVMLMLEQATLEKEPPKSRYRPDGMINQFNELLNSFPPRI